jgi:uncharacterized protein YqhQ
MGLRFQKRIKFGKFFTLNLSKSGVSGSAGVEGAQVTVGHGKIRKTVGLPGTGLSYSTVKSLCQKQEDSTKPAEKKGLLTTLHALLVHIVVLSINIAIIFVLVTIIIELLS